MSDIAGNVDGAIADTVAVTDRSDSPYPQREDEIKRVEPAAAVPPDSMQVDGDATGDTSGGSAEGL